VSMDFPECVNGSLALSLWGECMARQAGGTLLDCGSPAPGGVDSAPRAGELSSLLNRWLGEESFQVEELPAGVVGGEFGPFPEVALTRSGRDPREVFEEHCTLAGGVDDSDAVAFGLVSALVAEATATVEREFHCHYWMSGVMRGWLREWNTGNSGALGHVGDELGNMLSFGINLRGRDARAFSVAWRRELELRPRLGRGWLEAAKGMVAALTWAGQPVHPAFAPLASEDSCAVAACSWSGALAGAWLGASGLESMATDIEDGGGLAPASLLAARAAVESNGTLVVRAMESSPWQRG